MKDLFNRLSLSHRFLAVSFPIMLAGTLLIGWWTGLQVVDGVLHKTGGVTALYVDSLIASHAQTLAHADDLAVDDRAQLRAVLDTALGRRILSLKIWHPDGRLLWSSDHKDVGRRFPIGKGLAVALEGGISAEIDERSESERADHGDPGERSIEIYTPIHAQGTGRVIGAAEFYQPVDEVEQEADSAQRRSWRVVAATMLTLYALLFAVVRGGSRTIQRQQASLRESVEQLTALNRQNTQLHERVRRAAERAGALNEAFLQRLSADIHDGPGQDLGYALMQLKNIEDRCSGSRDPADARCADEMLPVRSAVQVALDDLRAISADLQLPEIGRLSLADIAARVVRDHEARSGAQVALATDPAQAAADYPIKIAVYRLLKEALANTLRHADGRNVRVRLDGDGRRLGIEVTDDGPGFETAAARPKGRLGLSGMRQRAEALGGSFELRSAPGAGTCVRIWLPLKLQGDELD